VDYELLLGNFKRNDVIERDLRGVVVIWLVRYPGLYAAVEAYLPFG